MLFVSIGGYTSGVDTTHSRTANERELVLMLDDVDVQEWIDASDRGAWLEVRLTSAALRA